MKFTPTSPLPLLLGALLTLATADLSRAADWPPGFSVPESTLSPTRQFGVLVPDEDHYREDRPQNKLVEVATGRVLAVIQAETGMVQMNHGGISPKWSADGSLLYWKVEGKWFPRALVLLKIAEGAVLWQTNLLKEAQKATLARTLAARPKAYAAAKKENRGNGSAYPDGFTIEVTTPVDEEKPVALPLAVHAELTSNPKGIEDYPKAARLDSRLEGTVDPKGKFTVTKFSAGTND
jgi:hypothetical protein